MKKQKNVEVSVCDICTKEVKENIICAICGNELCDKCAVTITTGEFDIGMRDYAHYSRLSTRICFRHLPKEIRKLSKDGCVNSEIWTEV